VGYISAEMVCFQDKKEVRFDALRLSVNFQGKQRIHSLHLHCKPNDL